MLDVLDSSKVNDWWKHKHSIIRYAPHLHTVFSTKILMRYTEFENFGYTQKTRNNVSNHTACEHNFHVHLYKTYLKVGKTSNANYQ